MLNQLLELAAQVEHNRKINRLKYYKPYAKQLEFHNAKGKGTDSPAAQRMFLAANQFGKCACKNSYIEHPDGTRSTFGEMYENNSPFPVLSWDGEKIVNAMAVTPIRKPKVPCVRLWFENGQWFDCALEHRVLDGNGVYVFVESLLASVPNLLESNLELSQSIHGVDGRHWNQIQRDFLVGCLDCLRLCDVLLHVAQGGVRSFFQRLICVRQHDFVLFCLDGYHSIHTSIPQSTHGHQANQDVGSHSLGRFFGFLDKGVCKFFQLVTQSIQVVQRLFVVEAARLQSSDEVCSHQYLFSQAFDGSLLDGNRIVAYQSIPAQEVYDFTVPVYKNYIAAGVVHHNTTAGAMEAAIHLTGRYPDWWEGVTYNWPVEMMVGSNTNETCRDIIQKEMFGNPLDDKEIGTGTIPKDCIGKSTRKAGIINAIDSCLIKHHTDGVFDGWSKVYLRAYEQGFKKFMGIRFQVGWLDEEPPQEIWSQFLRAQLAQKFGILYITMTPEEGMTKVVTQFVNELAQGQAHIQATWDDAAHFSEEDKQAKLMAFPAHEREMRSKGVPMMGAGLVFSTSEDSLVVDPFEIPRHWPQIIGIDFGWDHPFASCKIVWDRDNDCIYLTNEYRESKAIPAIHAMAIKAWGDWVPVAWPHDGLSTEKGTGEQLRDKYVEAGLNLLPWKSTNAPQAGQSEGEGGNSVWAGIIEMNQRMESGRFKVFSTCTQWLSEKRMYHTDKNGKLVKLTDDLISASRYATAMLRHARVQSVRPRVMMTSRGKSNWS